MKADEPIPLHADVKALIEDIKAMADQIGDPFVADPAKVQKFNAGYLQSLKNAQASVLAKTEQPPG